MSRGDFTIRNTLKRILLNGTLDENPRPVYASDGAPAHTLSFNHVIHQYDIAAGECPLMTCRPIAWKSAIKEILWIYQMQSNRLSDLHDLGIRYWDQWDVGDGTIGCRYGETVRRHNLMNKLLDGLKNNPFGRRHIVCMWQEDDFSDETGGTTKGLNPCCYETIWNVRRNKTDGELYLDMLLNQRSSDTVVSCSINEVQYVALMLMVAKAVGMKPGVFTHVIENAQIYTRHKQSVIELLGRDPVGNPCLVLDTKKTDFYSFTIDDFKMTGYDPEEVKKKNPQVTFDLGI